MTCLSRWLLTRPARTVRRPLPLGVLALEDRLVPTGRPLPLPVIAAGAGVGAPPAAKLFDAETGATLMAVTPFGPTALGGVRVAVADLTHDTYPDLVVAAGPDGGPHVRVYDGKTGQPMAGPLGSFFAYDPSFQGGVQVAAGDLTGDGWADVVTAADTGGGPHVRVFDGQTGLAVASFFAFEPEFHGGVRLAVGEFYPLGRAQLAVAAGPGGGPRVRVLDPVTWQPIPSALGDFFAFDPQSRGGVNVAAGDVTGDGRADLVAGAGAGEPSTVRVFDAKDGAVAREIVAFDPPTPGGVRVATAFVSDDPFADVVVGTGLGADGRVKTFDGATGQPLTGPVADFDPGVGAAGGGVWVAAGNDPGSTPSISGYEFASGNGYFRPGVPFTVYGIVEAAQIREKYYEPRLPGWVAGSVPPTGTVTFVLGLSRTGASGTFRQVVTSAPLAAVSDGKSKATFAMPGTGDPDETYFYHQFYYTGDSVYMTSSVSTTMTGGKPLPTPLAPPCVRPTGPVGGTPPWAPAGPPPTVNGVRLVDGVASAAATDLQSDGFGDPWRVSRAWASDPAYSYGAAHGNGWSDPDLPRLARTGGAAAGAPVVLFAGGAEAQYFDGQGTQDAGGNYPAYLPRFTDQTQVTYDATAARYVVANADGSVARFRGFADAEPTALRGAFDSRTSPAGVVTSVASRDAAGRPLDVQRSGTENGDTVTESFLRTYLPDGSGTASGLVASVTLRRRVNGGAWQTVRAVSYAYTAPDPFEGGSARLTLATVADPSGATVDQSYYRYYGGAYAAGTNPGAPGLLKFALGPVAYARARAALGGTDAGVAGATDAQLAPYADTYNEYDGQRRVTKAVVGGAGCSACAGGQGTDLFTYTLGGGTGFNGWKTRTAVAHDDGSTDVVYTNPYGQVMLTSTTGPGLAQPVTAAYRYADAGGWAGGQLVQAAAPSAVTGYDDTYLDLVHYQGGNAQYLADGAGLVTTYGYGASTTATATAAGDAAGYLKAAAVRQGELGADVPQAALTYYRQTAAAAAATPVATSTRYRNADGTGGQTTAAAYTWYSGTAQPATVATTLPAVTAGQNGPGAATTTTTAYDPLGRPLWQKDAGGFLAYTAFDLATGAATKTVRDVDTAQTTTFSSLPSGWVTPTGGGLHLTTTSEVDALGRAVKTTAPNGRVDYAVYDDPGHAVRTYPGWDATANAPTGPTAVWRDDRAGGYTESLAMSAAPAVSGGRPTGAEAISGLQSVTRTGRNLAGQAVTTDVYHSLTGLTYTTAATFGASGTNFDRTQQGYDKRGRPNKTVTPAGTISRTERDGLGRATGTWVGTDDVPTTGFWSPANLPGTDMTLVREHEYDNGGVGNGNRTKTTEHPGLSAPDRVTQTWFDWRDRPVAVKQGVEATETTDINRPLTYTQYDNRGESVLTERYDADGVTPTMTGGVPDRPSASLLRAKSGVTYDELGRAYRQDQYSVDPATGSVGTYTLHADTWYDKRGNGIKTLAPGGLVSKTAFDGAGRATVTSQTDGGGDTAWADALTVTGDAVLTQTEFVYDASGNVLTTTTRDRFHDATGTGGLGTPTSGVPARVSSAGYYYDLADRLVASVDVGTYGGTTWTRPGTVPARSDTALVSSTAYDAAGRAWKSTDPRGIETRTTYDAAGRVVKTVQNYMDGVVSDADDKTTEYAYGPAGLVSLTADLTGGGGQTTQWVYGVTVAGGSGLASNEVVGKTWWPDPATGAASSSQQDSVQVNALGQPVTTVDRNGTSHALGYDVLGRPASDAVTLLGTNVDGAVRRVATAYDGRGNAALVTSYDAATGGGMVNQVQRDFNGLGQLTSDWQAHGGAVSGATPRVQYGYSGMPSGANHSRPTTLTYPDGRVVTSNYSAGLNDSISRLSGLADGSTTLEGYDYLGLGTVVRRTRPQTGLDLSYVKLSGESTGDAGDQYTGLDRFGRVVDQRWLVSSTGTAVDRSGYTYDRDGNRTARTNGVSSGFGETYSYDGLNQLATFARGTHTQAWGYDAAGNWGTVTTDGTAQSRTANRQNEVTAVGGATTPAYDAAGNMTGDEAGRTLVYDAWNRLVAVKSGATVLAAYGYDGLGRRVSETAGGTTTDLYYSAGWQVLEERVGGVATTQSVWSPVYVDALVVRDRDADNNASTGIGGREERLYALQDANWNTTALVNATTGAVVERYAYDPFGQQIVMDAGWTPRTGNASLYGWVVGFQGLRAMAGTGLLDGRKRDYSVANGRWTTTDPIDYHAGNINLYGYVGNNPTNHNDPSGLQSVPNQIAGAIFDPVIQAIFGNIQQARVDFYTAVNGGCMTVRLVGFSSFKVDSISTSPPLSLLFPNYPQWLLDYMFNATLRNAANAYFLGLQLYAASPDKAFIWSSAKCRCDNMKCRLETSPPTSAPFSFVLGQLAGAVGVKVPTSLLSNLVVTGTVTISPIYLVCKGTCGCTPTGAGAVGGGIVVPGVPS